MCEDADASRCDRGAKHILLRKHTAEPGGNAHFSSNPRRRHCGYLPQEIAGIVLHSWSPWIRSGHLRSAMLARVRIRRGDPTLEHVTISAPLCYLCWPYGGRVRRVQTRTSCDPLLPEGRQSDANTCGIWPSFCSARTRPRNSGACAHFRLAPPTQKGSGVGGGDRALARPQPFLQRAPSLEVQALFARGRSA